MTDPIRNKIIELVPDAEKYFGLAVVLRAARKIASTDAITDALLKERDLVREWDLVHDSYDQQPPEIKKLVGALFEIYD